MTQPLIESVPGSRTASRIPTLLGEAESPDGIVPTKHPFTELSDPSRTASPRSNPFMTIPRTKFIDDWRIKPIDVVPASAPLNSTRRTALSSMTSVLGLEHGCV